MRSFRVSTVAGRRHEKRRPYSLPRAQGSRASQNADGREDSASLSTNVIAWVEAFRLPHCRQRHPRLGQGCSAELELAFNVLQNNVAISACRDIAKAGTHAVLSYGSLVKDVKRSDHVAPGALNTAGNPEQRLWRLSVELRDGRRFYMETWPTKQ